MKPNKRIIKKMENLSKYNNPEMTFLEMIISYSKYKVIENLDFSLLEVIGYERFEVNDKIYYEYAESMTSKIKVYIDFQTRKIAYTNCDKPKYDSAQPKIKEVIKVLIDAGLVEAIN